MKGSVSQETLDKRLQNSEENLDLAIKRYVNELHDINNEQFDIVHSQINSSIKTVINFYLKELNKANNKEGRYTHKDIKDFFEEVENTLNEVNKEIII